MSEFSRVFDLRHLPTGELALEASAEERAALTGRFQLVRIDSLTARIRLEADGTTVIAKGRLNAAIVQGCAVSGEDLAVAIDEPVDLRFVPPVAGTADEVELDAAELDEIEMTPQGAFDLGEALAQSLALAIDPYAVGPQAEEARRRAGLLDPEASGPFAALAALKAKPD
jgi:uncharacterized metal-binding protein YceD (DUF177 family)